MISREITHYWFPLGEATVARLDRPVVVSRVALFAPTLTPEALVAALAKPLAATVGGLPLFAPGTLRGALPARSDLRLDKPFVIPAGAKVVVEGHPVEDRGWLLVLTEDRGW